MNTRKLFLSSRIDLMNKVKSLKKLFLPDRFYTIEFVDTKFKDKIGSYTYGNPWIIDWGDKCDLKIGNFCSIAGGTTILLGGNHRDDWVTTYPFPKKIEFWPEAKGITGESYAKGDVIIGNDVQIGQDALILSGVKIGDGAIIGARAVVTKDVEPYAIVAGNPAKVIRKRFSEPTIKELLKIAWWNWPVEKIREFIPLLCDENIEAFIKKAKTTNG